MVKLSESGRGEEREACLRLRPSSISIQTSTSDVKKKNVAGRNISYFLKIKKILYFFFFFKRRDETAKCTSSIATLG